MKLSPIFFLLCLLALALNHVCVTHAAENRAAAPWRLTLNSLGPIRIGMTVPQASQALGAKLQIAQYHQPNPSCYYVIPRDKRLNGVRLMVTHHKISRIDIENHSFSTISGAKIGMTEKQIKAKYTPLQIEPHRYANNGHYIIYRSKDPLYRPYSLLFETDGNRVTSFRAGYREEVNYVEGCA